MAWRISRKITQIIKLFRGSLFFTAFVGLRTADLLSWRHKSHVHMNGHMYNSRIDSGIRKGSQQPTAGHLKSISRIQRYPSTIANGGRDFDWMDGMALFNSRWKTERCRTWVGGIGSKGSVNGVTRSRLDLGAKKNAGNGGAPAPNWIRTS